jgi:hypothetical protein
MNQHVFDYLRNLAWQVMPPRGVQEYQERRDHVIAAVQQFPKQHRSFIAGVAWAWLGYGGGI